MLFAYLFAELPKYNPRLTWWENLFVSAVFFGALAIMIEVFNRFFKNKPEPLPTEQKVKE